MKGADGKEANRASEKELKEEEGGERERERRGERREKGGEED